MNDYMIHWVFKWISEFNSLYVSLKCLSSFELLLDGPGMPFTEGIVWPQASQTCCDSCCILIFQFLLTMFSIVKLDIQWYCYVCILVCVLGTKIGTFTSLLINANFQKSAIFRDIIY